MLGAILNSEMTNKLHKNMAQNRLTHSVRVKQEGSVPLFYLNWEHVDWATQIFCFCVPIANSESAESIPLEVTNKFLASR